MRRNVFSFPRAGLLATGLLLTIAQPAGAQPDLPFIAGSLQGGPMLSENHQQFENNPQTMMALTISASMCRNIYVETLLSGLALKHTSNADIKSFAREMIAVDRRFETQVNLSQSTESVERYGRGQEVSLPESDNTFLCASFVPSETRQAEKEMKKLFGPQFDQKYLVQMDAYIRNDREVGARASVIRGAPDVNAMGILARDLAKERETQISHLTAEENFKIK
ncbi:MAG: DUF4142 domain-containing protein [Terriglobia bacterium]|nr:DUF4142 domain-containing protein [Terriglobia bacterium]